MRPVFYKVGILVRKLRSYACMSCSPPVTAAQILCHNTGETSLRAFVERLYTALVNHLQGRPASQIILTGQQQVSQLWGGAMEGCALSQCLLLCIHGFFSHLECCMCFYGSHMQIGHPLCSFKNHIANEHNRPDEAFSNHEFSDIVHHWSNIYIF